MPIYTYQCENCGVRFDRQQSFSDPALKKCPECMQETLRKVYTPVGIVFKGSGFYSTDNRSPSGSRPKSEKSSTETTESDSKIKKEKTEKSTKAKED